MQQQRGFWRGAVVFAALAGPAPLAGQVILTSDAGAFNNYTWRGVTLTNKLVVQPDAYLTVPGGGGSARGSLVRRWAGGVGVGIGVRIGAHGEPRAWMQVKGALAPGCHKVGRGKSAVNRNVQNVHYTHDYLLINWYKLHL